MHAVYTLLIAGALALWPTPSAADQGSSDAWQQLDAFARERDRDELERRQRQLLAPAPASAPQASKAPGRCEPIQGLRLHGNRLLSDAQLRLSTAPYLAPCMSPAAINQVLEAITAQYVLAGYIGARPYRLAPREPGGPLQVLVVEGEVEAVEVTDPDLPLSLGNAFGTLPGKPLHLPTLERGLDQLNRLRVLDLTADLLPGQRTGGTRVRLTPLSHPPRAWPTVLLDNRGSASSGRNRALLTFNLDSPARWNDALVLGVQRTLPAGPNFNRSYFGGYSVPHGPWQLSLNAARYAYRSRSPAAHGAVVSQGSGTVYGAALERQLWRDRSSLYSTTLRATHKAIETYVQGRFSGLQSPTYNSLGLQLDALWSGHGQWNAQLLYSRGLGGWRADDGLPRQGPASPSATFGLWRTTLGHTRSGRVLGQRWHWGSQLGAQYTGATLPGPDQLYLSGDLSLRGFRDLPASFDRGAYWQNTLSLPRPLPMGLALVPRVGLDIAQGDGRLSQRGERLVGSALGASLSRGELAMSFDYHHPLYRRQGERPAGYWQLQLQARL